MIARESLPHEHAMEMLPWLVNDSLLSDERAAVLDHAQSCVMCRREMKSLEDLRDSVEHAGLEQKLNHRRRGLSGDVAQVTIHIWTGSPPLHVPSGIHPALGGDGLKGGRVDDATFEHGCHGIGLPARTSPVGGAPLQRD